jgi:hypothetical protein
MRTAEALLLAQGGFGLVGVYCEVVEKPYAIQILLRLGDGRRVLQRSFSTLAKWL